MKVKSIAVSLLGVIGLGACANSVPLTPAGQSTLSGANLATATEQPPEYFRKIQKSNAAAQAGFLGAFIDGFNNASNLRQTSFGQIPMPQYDLAGYLEQTMTKRLAESFGTKFVAQFDGGTTGESLKEAERAKWLKDRSPDAATVVLDVYTTSWGTISSGKGLGFGTEKFNVTYSASAVLVEAQSGALLAHAECKVAGQPLTLGEYLGRGGTDGILRDLEGECAAQFEKGFGL